MCNKMSQATVSFISDDGEEFQPCTPPEGAPACALAAGAAPPTPNTPSFGAAVVAASGRTA